MEKQLLLLSSGEETVSYVRKTLEPLKYCITVKNKLSSGLKAMNGRELVLLDMPNNLHALREIKSYCPEATVLVAAGPEQAQLALDDGAYHFLKKPIKPHELKSAVRHAAQSIFMRSKLDQMKGLGPPRLIMGMGETMRKVLRQIERAAAKDVAVLVVGEQGSGKMLVAETIHRMSSRRIGAFIVANKHKNEKIGNIIVDREKTDPLIAAEGGVLVINNLHRYPEDDMGRLSEQMKHGMLLPGGAKADVRVVATSEVYKKGWPLSGRFRSIIHMPPLRERKGDIPLIADHFVSETAGLFGDEGKIISDEAMKTLVSHDWPGNVSELKNTVRRAYLLCRGHVIEPCHISTDDGSTYCSIKDFFEAKLSKYIKELVSVGNSGLHTSVMGEVEKTLIELVLRETDGNQVRASNALGITRTTLRTKIRNYGLNGSSQKKRRP